MAQNGYFQRISLQNRGPGLIKFRLIITPDLFVQINRNETSNITNFALIYKENRIYGRDGYQNEWHQHTAAAPRHHNRDVEGNRASSLTQFLSEVDMLLRSKHLI